MSVRFAAIASDWPACSAGNDGHAPTVSISVTTGSPNRSASRKSRCAVR